MPQAAKHDSYAEFIERKNFPNTNFSRAETPNWCAGNTPCQITARKRHTSHCVVLRILPQFVPRAQGEIPFSSLLKPALDRISPRVTSVVTRTRRRLPTHGDVAWCRPWGTVALAEAADAN